MKSWSDMTAEEVMSSPVITLDRNMPLEEAARTLAQHRVSGALVAEADGSICGVVSISDITSNLAGFERPPMALSGFYRHGSLLLKGRERPEQSDESDDAAKMVGKIFTLETPVGEIMSREIIAVPTDEPLAQVARTLREREIHRVFVTDGTRPVGVVSTMDILEALAGISHSRSRVAG
jgi:CBS domain-containing protein